MSSSSSSERKLVSNSSIRSSVWSELYKDSLLDSPALETVGFRVYDGGFKDADAEDGDDVESTMDAYFQSLLDDILQELRGGDKNINVAGEKSGMITYNQSHVREAITGMNQSSSISGSINSNYNGNIGPTKAMIQEINAQPLK